MNTTILTENSHPQSTGGHRTGSSLNMSPKSWKDYVPRYVSLYYVDYNENLDSREDLQERCIRRNSLHPLEEQVWEWYAEQEHDNLQGYLADIRKAMEADGKADEYARNEEGIKDLLYERNSIDPADELIDNSAVTNMFYSLGVEIEGYVYGSNARGESEAISLRKIRRALKLKKGSLPVNFMSFWPMPHTEASSASISMPDSPDCSREIPEMISSASGSTEMSSLPLRTAATVQDTMSGCQRTSPSRLQGQPLCGLPSALFLCQ